MSRAGLVLTVVVLLGLVATTLHWTRSAAERLERGAHEPGDAAPRCAPSTRDALRRVLERTGPGRGPSVRLCRAPQVPEPTRVSEADFDALFAPGHDGPGERGGWGERSGIVLHDLDGAALDPTDRRLIEDIVAEGRGAGTLVVAARAPRHGPAARGRALARRRALAVLEYLKERFDAPDLHRRVALLWLAEDAPEVDRSFCRWRRSGVDRAAAEASQDSCSPFDLQRGTFLAWVDCT